MKRMKFIPFIGLGLTLFLTKPSLIYASSGYGGGSGTESDPYLISTPEHLNQLQLDVNVNKIDTSGKYYRLINDIDLSGYDNDSDDSNGNFTPIGKSSSVSFKGVFDGNGNTISNLKVILPDQDYVGLFGHIYYTAMIRNVGVKDVLIEGNDYTGGLVGYQRFGTTTESYVTGSVIGNNRYTGGLIGFSDDSIINNSYATGSVTGQECVGGFIGKITSSIVENSHATGVVKGNKWIGGFVGTTWEAELYNNYATVDVIGGELSIGGFAGTLEGNTITSNSYSTGNVGGDRDVGGFVGYADSSIINQSFASGNVVGSGYVGGLVGMVSQPLTISNSYSLSDVTGESEVGGLVGSIDDYYGSDQVAILENSYHDGTIVGTTSTGTIVGHLGYYDSEDDIWYNGSVSLDNVYYNQEKNPNYSTVGDTAHGTVIQDNTIGLTIAQMTKHKAKENMSNLDFENIWVMTSTTPMFRWQKDLISATDGDIQINGKIETMVADITIPSVSPDLVINPNLSEGFVAPEFSVSNDSVSPIKLELKTFEQTTNTFNDVLPTKYDSWIGLNKKQSQDIALGLIAKEGEGWQTLATPTSYVANHTEHEIGIIKPTSSVDFSFDVKHGTSFSEAKTVQYKMVFVFDLLN